MAGGITRERGGRHPPRETCHSWVDLPLWGVNKAPDGIILEKRALRWRIKTWRAGLGVEAMTGAADAVAAHGLGFLRLGQRQVVISGFSSLPEEFRAWPLLR